MMLINGFKTLKPNKMLIREERYIERLNYNIVTITLHVAYENNSNCYYTIHKPNEYQGVRGQRVKTFKYK